MRSILTMLRKDGTTVLLSSHLLNDVQNICQNISIINRGKSVAEGTFRELSGKRSGSTTYIAEFSQLDDGLLSDVEKMENVTECIVAEGDAKSVKITVSGVTDIREKIARAAIEHDSVLLSCNARETSLEELFLSMVGEENGSGNVE